MAAHNGWALSAAWCDYDGDGDPDAYVTQPIDRNLLYRNRGDGTFDEVAAAAGVDVVINMGGAVWGDYDGDGHPDLYVTQHKGIHLLFRNLGNGTFANVTFSAGVEIARLPYKDPTNVEGILSFNRPVQATFGDYDGDGTLDLVVATGPTHASFLYRNKGDGTFEEVGVASGLDDYNTLGSGNVLAWADYDGDGDLDLFMAFYNSGSHRRPSALYQNHGNGTFTNVATAAFSATVRPDSATDAAWGDYDGDGDLDLYIISMKKYSMLFRNHGNGTFDDVSYSSGAIFVGNPSSAAWADYARSTFSRTLFRLSALNNCTAAV